VAVMRGVDAEAEQVGRAHVRDDTALREGAGEAAGVGVTEGKP
jgi:hypothetical protein